MSQQALLGLTLRAYASSLGLDGGFVARLRGYQACFPRLQLTTSAWMRLNVAWCVVQVQLGAGNAKRGRKLGLGSPVKSRSWIMGDS